jgi:hypothetical protein
VKNNAPLPRATIAAGVVMPCVAFMVNVMKGQGVGLAIVCAVAALIGWFGCVLLMSGSEGRSRT